MLSSMRKNAGSLIIKILFAVIIIVFVLWGVGTDQSQRANRVAAVNGEVITLDEYGRVYENLVDQMRSRFGGQLDNEMIQTLNLRGQAVNQLVDEKIMLHEAQELDLKVSPEELTESIRKIPAFQVNGAFDIRQYNRVLNSNRLTPEAFEAAQRRGILIRKLNRLISQGAKVSDAEARDWFEWQNASVNVEYILFTPEDYPEKAVEADEVAVFFEENREAYKTELQVKAQYLVFKPEAYRQDVTISEDEVQEYYDENTDEFKKPETVEARHILLKVSEDADETVVASVRQKADDIYQKAIGGEDFVELAKTFSEGPTRDTGGFLGTFQRGTMVKPFEEKAFSMEAGEISEPVRTPFGWHVIKVEKKNLETVLSPGEAENRIRGQLTDRKARLAAYDDAQDAYDATYDGADIPAIAESVGVELRSTERFTRQGPSGLGDADRFAGIAFDLEVGEISEVEELADGYYLIQMVERKPSEVPDLEAVRDRVEKDLKSRKRKEQASADADKYLEMIRSGASFSEAATAAGRALSETGFFKRNATIAKVGSDRDFSEAAFSLSEKKVLPDEPVDGQKGFYVIRFKERKLPETEEFEKSLDSVKNQLLSRKQFAVYQSWLQAARERSEIEIEAAFLE